MREEPRRLELISARNKFAGYLIFEKFSICMRPSLVAYLKQGWCVETSVAIDFTLSNLEITDFKSLHRITHGSSEMN